MTFIKQNSKPLTNQRRRRKRNRFHYWSTDNSDYDSDTDTNTDTNTDDNSNYKQRRKKQTKPMYNTCHGVLLPTVVLSLLLLPLHYVLVVSSFQCHTQYHTHYYLKWNTLITMAASSNKLYDIDAIAKMTNEFRHPFAFMDVDVDNSNELDDLHHQHHYYKNYKVSRRKSETKGNNSNISSRSISNRRSNNRDTTINSRNSPHYHNKRTLLYHRHHQKQQMLHTILEKDDQKSRGKIIVTKGKSNDSRSNCNSNGGGGGALGHHLSYKSTIQVLKTFHSLHGHLVIPRRYTIKPSSPIANLYPKQWHNIDIASTVYNMKWWSTHVRSNPDRVKELNSLGFVWERLQPEWNNIVEAMVVYKSIYGHVKVPATFVVPYDNDNNSDHGSSYDSDDECNQSNGMTWPKSTWGITLGNCVHRIRTRGDFLRNDELAFSRRSQLEGLGFVWDVHEDAFGKFFRALKIFAKLEQKQQQQQSRTQRVPYQRKKALRIPQRFVVPATITLEDGTTNPWPKDLWNYPLGIKCAAIRQKELYVKNNPERQRALQEIGFQMSGNTTIGWLNIIWASAIYSKIHGKGTLDVPISFVVPAPPSTNSNPAIDNDLDTYEYIEDWPWPEQLWGFPLGQRLKDVRVKGSHLKSEESANARRSQLDALGFVWEPKRGRRKRCLGDGASTQE